jgi:ketosteroid isomerase-like protein
MSQENVEIVRAVLNALNRRDVEAVLGFADSEIQWRPITSALSGEIYHGHAGLQHWIEEIYRDWEVFENAPEQFHDLGDRVLVLGTWHARGPKSGLQLDGQPGAWLARLHHGRIIRWDTFTNRAEALKVAGLSEQAMSQENEGRDSA